MSRAAPTLRRNLVRYGLDVDDAEDLVQEVFARALAYRPGFPTFRDFARWATVVARNLAYDRLRELERVEPADVPRPPLPDPAEEVEHQADIEALVRAYESLSESDRRVLYAAATDSRPEDERERARFRSWLNRALGRLRGRMRGWLIALPRLRPVSETDGLIPLVGGALLVIELATGLSVGSASSTALEQTAGSHDRLDTTDTTKPTSRAEPARSTVAAPVRPPLPRLPGTAVAQPPPPERHGDATPERVRYEHVDVRGPSGERLLEVDTHEPPSKDPPLACLRNIPLVGTTCVKKSLAN